MGRFDDLDEVKRRAIGRSQAESAAKESAVADLRKQLETKRLEYIEVISEFCSKTGWTFTESDCEAHYHDGFRCAQGSFEIRLHHGGTECHIKVSHYNSFGTDVSGHTGGWPGRCFYLRRYTGTSPPKLVAALREMYAKAYSF